MNEGPYRSTIEKAVTCGCHVLEEGVGYTYNQFADECGFGDPRTVRNNIPHLAEINTEMHEKCKKHLVEIEVRKLGLIVERSS